MLLCCCCCRFAKEYSLSPGRGYGSGVIQVLKKLASPHLNDVFQPARAQFSGRGSFGNGGAMRAAPFALAFSNPADVRRVSDGEDDPKISAALQFSCSYCLTPPPPHLLLSQYSRLGAMLTHSCSLGYNGAVLQALAVHLSLQGALAVPYKFINKLISEMEEVEAEEAARNDARV